LPIGADRGRAADRQRALLALVEILDTVHHAGPRHVHLVETLDRLTTRVDRCGPGPNCRSAAAVALDTFTWCRSSTGSPRGGAADRCGPGPGCRSAAVVALDTFTWWRSSTGSPRGRVADRCGPGPGCRSVGAVTPFWHSTLPTGLFFFARENPTRYRGAPCVDDRPG
jgi:hypothetical protein